ncbi:ankyrin repeat-containing domain protein [Talaromyces proteolyticus]|uniref:Ankyrin repeat-containing domain protein n=1 Tax=Talaromyces proteolyticus TaxID=1131652 RepID=A0AAD4L005_9EURO|nr:ankyrin repeat-containing domain protein [Talaromyces proteolyticus]KAH8703261.1 ankyrin repeat-containing domain protein [Talaromyces proteolyticus]
MAELLSILQVAEIATKTSIQLYDFFSTITHAPQEIRGITRDINSFNTLVCNLTASLKSPDVRAIIENDLEITNAIESLKEPIGNSRKTFEKMEEKLRPHLKEDISSSEPPKGNGDAPAQQRRLSRTDVKWYFKRKEVYSLLGEMERNKVTFGDAMGYVTLLLSFKTSAIMKANSAATGPKPQDATIKTPFDDDAGSALIRFAETASTLPQGSLSDSKPLVDTRSSMVEPEETESQLTDTLIQAVKIGSLPLVKASLEKANINGQDRDGRTPLSFAAELGHVQVTELLLARGAIVSIRQYSNHRQQGSSEPLRESGRTPLLWAAAKGNSAIVHLLLQYGANPNARSTSGRFALQEATMNNNVDIVKLLLQYKADANARSYNFVRSLFVFGLFVHLINTRNIHSPALFCDAT